VSGFYLCANKNKRSICINLKSPEGKAALLRLVAEADVVMENFRPGTLDRLGLGYEALRGANPEIIFASASGYGADGPYAELPGQDLLVQARTGLVRATSGQRPGILPSAAGCAAVDQHGGALFALGILGAVVRKLKAGKGTRVETSLFNAGIDLQQEAISNYLNGNKTPEVFDRDPHLATWFHEGPYGIYETADHRHIALSLNPMELFDKALGESDLSADAELDTYLERDRVAEDIAKRISAMTLEEAEAALTRHKVWYAPVKDYSELRDDPQAIHNNVFRTAAISGQNATLVNHPNRYDGEVPGLRHVAERPGQDTDGILSQYGFTAEEIGGLRAGGAVA
jgi:crotonobetainyl-CoA:carnitine CoA-transferase CaiB-like acyl-CoA transferase